MIKHDQVYVTLKSMNLVKVNGPGGLTSCVLIKCASELAPVLAQFYSPCLILKRSVTVGNGCIFSQSQRKIIVRNF